MAGIFVTGGTGFLGRCLLPGLVLDRGRTIFVLSRDRKLAMGKLPQAPNLQVVEADLADPDIYRSALAECDTVLHLAAVTGKAGAADYYRVNASGTEALVAACAEAGVKNFLYISSIAVKFPEKKYYHYALAKEQGESAVRSGLLHFIILRPTLIAGKGSPALAGLARLACLPRPLVFGPGRAMVQPILAADLAAAICEIVSAGRFNNETLELGGKESLSIEAFMKRIRIRLKGRSPAAMHWPLALTIGLLGVLEKFLSPILPISAGQLYSFRCDGLAGPNDLSTRLSPFFRNVDGILEESFPRRDANDHTRLDNECLAIGRYLFGQEVSKYVQAKYRDGNVRLGLDAQAGRFDRLLSALAVCHPLLARAGDAYARFFAAQGVLRKKMVLLLAIAEVSPPTWRAIDATDGGGWPMFFARTMLKGTGTVLCLLLSLPVLLPLQLLLKLGGSRPRKGESHV